MNIIKMLAVLLIGMAIRPVISQELVVRKASVYKACEDDPFFFIYGKKNSPEWNALFDLLTYNRDLIKTAETLILVVSTDFHNSYDSLEWDDWEKQALTSGYKIRRIDGLDYIFPFPTKKEYESIVGFDYDKARHVFNIPPEQFALVMVAVEK